MKATTFLLAGAALLLSACSSNENNEPPQQATAAHVPHVVMSSMAEVNCSNAGGSLAFSRQLDGSRIGMCQLANGRRCDEQALIGGSCAR